MSLVFLFVFNFQLRKEGNLKGNQEDVISFVAVLDISKATKDGIHMNGYVVEINHIEAQKLDGLKLRITGEVLTVKSNTIDSKGRVMQGRSESITHIINPKIEIIK